MRDQNTTSKEITFRELGKTPNNLKITFEKPTDFCDNWVPTLDFKIGMDYTRNRYTNNYFEKEMNSRWLIPECSAMDVNQKRQILSNEFCRRMSRMDPEVHSEQAAGVINIFDRKLVFSGYDYTQRIREASVLMRGN